jgi:hypothetical protein
MAAENKSLHSNMHLCHCHIISHLMNPGQTGDEMSGLIALVEYAK